MADWNLPEQGVTALWGTALNNEIETKALNKVSSSTEIVTADLQLDGSLTGSSVTTIGEANKLVKTDGSGGIIAGSGFYATDDGSSIFMKLTQEGNAAAALIIQQDTVGDPTINLRSGGNTTFSLGIDYADNQKFKISNADFLGGVSLFELTSSGNITANGAATIETTSTTALDVKNGSNSVFRVDTENEIIYGMNNWQTPECIASGGESGIPVTMTTLPEAYACYNIYGQCAGGYSSTQSQIVGVLTTDPYGNSIYTSIKTSTYATLSTTGADVMMTQTTGSYRGLYLTIQRIA